MLSMIILRGNVPAVTVNCECLLYFFNLGMVKAIILSRKQTEHVIKLKCNVHVGVYLVKLLGISTYCSTCGFVSFHIKHILFNVFWFLS